ncbi:MAG: hypothetical protein IPN79_04680 [Saprospiraceae bacterium]|nr:hypothetical protein [Saprospiraceae bacterium]
MRTILKPKFSNFRIGENLQLPLDVITYLKGMDLDTLMLAPRVDELEATVNILNEAFMESKGDTLIAKLSPFDDERLLAARGLKKYLESETFRTEEGRSDQANVLLKSYNKYCNNITKLSLPHKSAVFTKMLGDWGKESEFKTAITFLGAETWIENLRTKQETFEKMSLAKTQSNLPKAVSAKMLNDVKSAFEELKEDIYAFSRVSADKQTYIQLIDALNGIIAFANSPAAKRKGRKGRDKQKPTPATDISTSSGNMALPADTTDNIDLSAF